MGSVIMWLQSAVVTEDDQQVQQEWLSCFAARQASFSFAVWPLAPVTNMAGLLHSPCRNNKNICCKHNTERQACLARSSAKPLKQVAYTCLCDACNACSECNACIENCKPSRHLALACKPVMISLIVVVSSSTGCPQTAGGCCYAV